MKCISIMWLRPHDHGGNEMKRSITYSNWNVKRSDAHTLTTNPEVNPLHLYFQKHNLCTANILKTLRRKLMKCSWFLLSTLFTFSLQSSLKENPKQTSMSMSYAKVNTVNTSNWRLKALFLPCALDCSRAANKSKSGGPGWDFFIYGSKEIQGILKFVLDLGLLKIHYFSLWRIYILLAHSILK